MTSDESVVDRPLRAAEPHPDVQALMDLAEQAGRPTFRDLGVEQGRALLESLGSAGEADPVGAVEDRTIEGPGGDLDVRVYRPATAAQTSGADEDGARPGAMLYFHGGGWALGSLDTHDATCRTLANESGRVVVSVDYRLAPEDRFPAAVEDAWAATQWVASAGDDIGIDTDRLAVAGDSAGGTLAAVVALLARDRGGLALDYQLLCYPALAPTEDMPSHDENATGYLLETADIAWFKREYLGSDVHARNPYAFPLQACDFAGVAPATVVTAGFDPIRDEGVAYVEALHEAGVAVRHRNYPDMIHGFLGKLAEPELTVAREALPTIAGDLPD